MAYVRKADRQQPEQVDKQLPVSVEQVKQLVTEEEQTYIGKLRALYQTIELTGAPQRTTIGKFGQLLELGRSNKVKYPNLITLLSTVTTIKASTPEAKIEAEQLLAAHGYTQVGGTIV